MSEVPEGETPKKKVDEDWKRRAAEEKVKLAAAKAAAPVAAKAESADAPAPTGPQQPEPPPEDAPARGRGGPFETLVTMLVQQASLVLGLVADPMTGERYQDVGQGKMLIDMLVTLKIKTKGNLTPGEDRLLTAALQELQMEFVNLADQIAAQRNKGPRPGPR